MKKSLYEILEFYIEQKYLRNKSIEAKCRDLLINKGKTEDEIHEILIEFDDEWTKEQLQGDGVKKGKRLMIVGFIGFVLLSSLTIVLAFRGILSTIMIGFVALTFFVIMKGYNEIKDAQHRKERRTFKWNNWK